MLTHTIASINTNTQQEEHRLLVKRNNLCIPMQLALKPFSGSRWISTVPIENTDHERVEWTVCRTIQTFCKNKTELNKTTS